MLGRAGSFLRDAARRYDCPNSACRLQENGLPARSGEANKFVAHGALDAIVTAMSAGMGGA